MAFKLEPIFNDNRANSTKENCSGHSSENNLKSKLKFKGPLTHHVKLVYAGERVHCPWKCFLLFIQQIKEQRNPAYGCLSCSGKK